MLTIPQNPDFTKLLSRIALALDIPDHVYEDATLKYEDVGDWIGADDSELAPYKPDIYVQGSFRLGTVVRPINTEDEYDIDLVCHLEIKKEETTQRDLKEMVGRRLKKRDDLGKMLQPSRRCWTLEYPPEREMPKFHMDILPAIPNIERPPTGILLTDSELKLWQKSNPRAYGDWFYERMKAVFEEKRTALAESIRASVEEVPEWQVKTPLQIAVQILKRHRDIHFQNTQDLRPISIIITTLAARSYENQPDVYEALSNTVRKIIENWGKPGFVEYRNGKWWVSNPVDDGENFADKWNEHPERREAFLAWIKKAERDFASAALKRSLNESATELTRVLGSYSIAEASADLGLPLASTLPAVRRLRAEVPALGNCAHCAPPQWPMAAAGYKADLVASVHSGKKKLWNLTDRSVPKNVWLRFSASTNVPQPYYVSWQVVNTGREASEARSLRGGFYESEAGANGVRWERTLYAGTHWVEAFIIKNGVCVARSGRKLVRIR